MRFEGEEIQPEKLPIPAGWRILVGKQIIEDTSSGGIVLPPQTVNEMECVGYVAKILAMGPECYRHPKFQGGVELTSRSPTPWVKTGDIVVIGQYTGQGISCQGSALKLINDDEVLAVVPDATSIDAIRR